MANILQVGNVRNATGRTTNRFSLQFLGLDAVLDRAKNSNLAAVKARYLALEPALKQTGWSLSQTLELSLLSVAVPSTDMEITMAHRFHDVAKHTIKFTPLADMNVTFYDYINGSASAIMFCWNGMVGERQTGAIGFKEDYVLPQAKLIGYGPIAPAEDVPTSYEEHAIINLYPKTIELGEHSYESGDIRKVTVTFSAEQVYPLSYRSFIRQTTSG